MQVYRKIAKIVTAFLGMSGRAVVARRRSGSLDTGSLMYEAFQRERFGLSRIWVLNEKEGGIELWQTK